MKIRSIIATLLALTALAVCCNKPENGGGGSEEGGETAPAVPASVKCTAGTESTLSFEWGAVNGADSYGYRVLKGLTQVASSTVKGTSVTVNGLEDGTAYKFAVRSLKGTAVSAWSGYVEGITEKKAGPDTPDEPEDPDTPKPIDGLYEKMLISSAEEADGLARAFPGAEGGGMWTTGGRGGKVLHVTNLEDSGEGSLRWACTQNYPRIIVFDVAGTIALNSQLQINRDDCTIAGQTAPGDGICIKNYTFRINANNVIVRFIRCRMGDERQTEDDAMQVMSHDEKYTNIIIDHCSVSWCTDECASFYGMKDFTFQWNIVSESLRNSIHDKGAHGYGGIWGGNNAAYHHNLLAHHDSRNPRIDHDYVSTQKGPVSIVDNVVYNWKGNTCYGGESANSTGDYRKYNFLNNYYKPGPVTPSNHIWFINPTTSCSNCTKAMGVSTVVPGHFYMTGNYMYGKSAMSADNWGTGASVSSSVIPKIKSETAFSAGTKSYITMHSAEASFDAVLGYAGASCRRDAIDARIARETKDGTYTYEGSKLKDKNGKDIADLSKKGLIDTQTDVADETWVNGWPVYAATNAELDQITDSDRDGIPDYYEALFGLDRKDASDAAKTTIDPKGRYTNLEMYLHWLVRETMDAGNAGGSYTAF